MACVLDWACGVPVIMAWSRDGEVLIVIAAVSVIGREDLFGGLFFVWGLEGLGFDKVSSMHGSMVVRWWGAGLCL
jgi:hypothetical protein